MTQLLLDDGRTLDVRVSGPEEGVPLVFHHGTPGSLYTFRALESAVHARGLRLVTYSRPGYGGSSRLPGRAVAHAAADVAAILDSISARRCLIAGWSGGGPHALACAAGLGDRVAGALCIAGVAPRDAEGLDFFAGMGEQNVEDYRIAEAGEEAIRLVETRNAEHLRDTDAAGIISGLSSLLPPVDAVQLTGEFGEDMAANFHEALRTGVDGWVDDDLSGTQPWGFDVHDIAVPTYVWHGSDDLMVPYGHGQWFAQNIPGAVAHLEEGEGHLSIAVGALDRMMDELVALL